MENQLSEADSLAISEDPQVAAFLNLYDRILTSDALHHLTAPELTRRRGLEGKFVRANGNTPQLERIYRRVPAFGTG
jgi:hypothetical protein